MPSNYRVLTSIPLADRLKADGVTIVTVDVNENSDRTFSRGLEEVATKNYDFGMQDGNLVGKIQEALLQSEFIQRSVDSKLDFQIIWKNVFDSAGSVP